MSRYAPKPDRRVLLAMITVSLLALFAVSYAQEEKKPTPTAGPAAPATPAARAPEKSAAAAPNAAEPGAPPAAATFKKPTQSPMVTEMMTLLAAQDEKLAELANRQKKATTSDEAIAVQREIQELKLGTEISLLRIQAAYARREGRSADADRLDLAVRDLVSPPRLASTSNRPAPVQTQPSR